MDITWWVLYKWCVQLFSVWRRQHIVWAVWPIFLFKWASSAGVSYSVTRETSNQVTRWKIFLAVSLQKALWGKVVDAALTASASSSRRTSRWAGTWVLGRRDAIQEYSRMIDDKIMFHLRYTACAFCYYCLDVVGKPCTISTTHDDNDCLDVTRYQLRELLVTKLTESSAFRPSLTLFSVVALAWDGYIYKSGQCHPALTYILIFDIQDWAPDCPNV